MSGFDEMIVHYLFQTAATIMKRNSSCSALQMVRDPLLKEIVSTFPFVWTCFWQKYFPTQTLKWGIFTCYVINLSQLLIFQSFGVAEGGRLQDVKEMAKAAGQSFPGFTPPGGETQEQVRTEGSSIYYPCYFILFYFILFILSPLSCLLPCLCSL